VKKVENKESLGHNGRVVFGSTTGGSRGKVMKKRGKVFKGKHEVRTGRKGAVLDAKRSASHGSEFKRKKRERHGLLK